MAIKAWNKDFKIDWLMLEITCMQESESNLS